MPSLSNGLLIQWASHSLFSKGNLTTQFIKISLFIDHCTFIMSIHPKTSTSTMSFHQLSNSVRKYNVPLKFTSSNATPHFSKNLKAGKCKNLEFIHSLFYAAKTCLRVICIYIFWYTHNSHKFTRFIHVCGDETLFFYSLNVREIRDVFPLKKEFAFEIWNSLILIQFIFKVLKVLDKFISSPSINSLCLLQFILPANHSKAKERKINKRKEKQ